LVAAARCTEHPLNAASACEAEVKRSVKQIMPIPPLPDELTEFLGLPNQCVVATIKADGSPHTAATWYLWNSDGTVLLNMDASRVRLKHLRRDPRLSLTVFPRGDWYSHVSISGRVREFRHDVALEDIDRMSWHYDGRSYGDRDRDSWTAVVEIQNWHSWGPLQANGA